MFDFSNKTMGEVVAAITAIHTTPKMLVFFNRYVEFLQTEAFGHSLEDAIAIARENIGWAYGEGMPPSQVRLWREVTGAEHPAGRIEEMSLDEIFEAGKRWAEESKDNRTREELRQAIVDRFNEEEYK